MRIRIVRDVPERLRSGQVMDIPDDAAGQLIRAGFAEELRLADVGGVGQPSNTDILVPDATDEAGPGPSAGE